MIIAKPALRDLTFELIRDNYPVTPEHYISLSYADGSSKIGYIQFGTDLEKFNDFLDYLNEDKSAALISVSNKINNFPIHFNHSKFALGIDCFSWQENAISALEKFLEFKFDYDSICFNWLIDSSFPEINPIVLMDNKGEFKFCHLYSKYIDAGIHFCILNKPFKHCDPDDIMLNYTKEGELFDI